MRAVCNNCSKGLFPETFQGEKCICEEPKVITASRCFRTRKLDIFEEIEKSKLRDQDDLGLFDLFRLYIGELIMAWALWIIPTCKQSMIINLCFLEYARRYQGTGEKTK